MDESTLRDLHDKHGQVWVFDGDEIVFRKPTRDEFKRFMSKASEAKDRANAMEEMVRACVVYPDAAAFGRILDEYPGLLPRLTVEISNAASKEATEHAKKYAPEPMKRANARA